MAWGNEDYGRPPGAGGDLGLSLATLLIGAFIGAAAALLLAPSAGQELRARVANAAGNWKEQAAEAISQGRESVISAVEQAQSATSQTDGRQDKGVVKPV